MIRKYLITVALIIGFSGTVLGEKLSLASASFEYIPSAELDRGGSEYDEVKTSSQTYTVKLALPLLLNGKKTVLLNFFTLRSLYQTYGDVNPGTNLYRPDYLYTFKYGLVFLQRLSEK